MSREQSVRLFVWIGVEWENSCIKEEYIRILRRNTVFYKKKPVRQLFGLPAAIKKHAERPLLWPVTMINFG